MRRQNPHPMSFLHKRYHRFRNYPEKEKKCLMKYEKLFQPGKIGNLELRNRVVMTAMGALMGDWNGCTTPEQIRFYEDRAKGGCGLIIPEFTSVDADSGHCNPIQLGIYDSRQIKSFQLICEAVHRHGAKIFIQLHHGGREAPPACNGGRQAMAPSVELNSVVGRATILPREMTIEDIDNLVEKYVQAAVNSELAGADGVEVHAAHGYLVQQFLSPYTNKRTDEYGGSMENRCRFLVRILTGIRAAVSGDFVVGARINGNDFVEGGNDLAACTEIAKYLEPYVDYFNVSCGVYASAPTMIEPCYSPEGWRKNLAKTIKAAVNVPIIAVNTIKHPETAERFLQEGVSDFVGMSRMQLADPDVVKKAMAGREDLIRKCLGCMNCNKSVVAGKNLHCAINPVTGRATVYGDENLVKTGDDRTVAVVGGGPGGMQAALLLKKRGYHPIILESSDHLGGSAVLASKAPCKGMVTELIETMKAEMKEYHIEVRLNTPATVETLRTLDPYGVVVACGGEQIVPNVPGADRSNVYYIEDVLMGRVSFEGKNIAVIGGGHVGLEVAHFLCDKNKVTVVEMQKEVGVTIYRTARYKLLSLLQESGVEILTEHAIAGVTDGAVELKKTDTGEIVTRPADIVVMALGNRPDKSYEQQLKDAFDKVVFVGDAHKGGTMADATLSAYENCWFF